MSEFESLSLEMLQAILKIIETIKINLVEYLAGVLSHFVYDSQEILLKFSPKINLQA